MAANKPENISWSEYVGRLEAQIKSRIDDESFLISSRTANGEVLQYRPISELREELNYARIQAASASVGLGSPFLSDCAL